MPPRFHNEAALYQFLEISARRVSANIERLSCIAVA